MDNRAGEMGVFVAAAETGSFSAAGRKLGLSPSAISKLITRIEDRLGMPLLVRTTRALHLTAEGSLYLDRARTILAEIEDAERLISSGQGAVARGRLRVSASVAFGELRLLPLLPGFLERYPEVEIDLSLTDTVIDLVDQRTDVAVRSGPLRDSTLKARKLLESRRIIVAAPAYLDRHGAPAHPHELARHNCLRFNFRRSMDEWPFADPDSGQSFSLPVAGNSHGNNGVILRRLALAGVGIGRFGRFYVADDIAAGRLVPVLEEFNPGDIELIHALYVGHDHLAARIRAFVDYLAQGLKEQS